MQFQRAGYGVGQGAHLLHAEADGTAAADAAQLLGDDLDAIRLRERTEDAQVQRDQAAQRLRQRGDVAASLADVDEDLERPVLIAVDGDVDLALRRADVPRVTMRYLRHRLDALLDGDNWLKHQRLLLWRWLSRLGWLLRLLLLNMREDADARAVAHIGDAFAAQFVGQAVELLHILDGVAIRRVHRLADAGVGEALDGCLHAHMLFVRQAVGGDEVGGRWLVGILVAPLLEQREIQDVFARAVTAHHREVVHRLDARTDARQQAGRPGRSLRQQHGIANALLPDLLLNMLRQLFDKLSLHVLLAIEPGKCPLLHRDIRRSLIGRVADRGIDALDDGKRFLTAVGHLHLQQRIGQSHRPQPRAPRPKLCLAVLLNEVFGSVDDVIQEAHRHLAHFRQPLPVHLPVFPKSGKIYCT